MKANHALSRIVALSLGVVALTTVFEVSAHEEQASEAGSNTTAEKIKTIDQHARKIEQSQPDLTRKEVKLEPGAMDGITDEKWSKLHAYSKEGSVERLKVYPSEGSSKTEEFYYRDGKLIMVFQEPKGVGHEGHDADAKGTRYYFDASGMFAQEADGKVTNTPGADQKAMGTKLQSESASFLALASKQ